MKVTDIKVGFGRTIQVKQYEPVRFDASLTATIDPKENVDEAANELILQARAIVEENISMFIEDERRSR